MSVHIRKTTSHTAEITWEPGQDDPHGYIAKSVEGDQLACALESLGGHIDPTAKKDYALTLAMHTTNLARLLERRAAVQVVNLRDHHDMSWRHIAAVLFDDPEKQSSVRRMYESGRRHLGT